MERQCATCDGDTKGCYFGQRPRLWTFSSRVLMTDGLASLLIPFSSDEQSILLALPPTRNRVKKFSPPNRQFRADSAFALSANDGRPLVPFNLAEPLRAENARCEGKSRSRLEPGRNHCAAAMNYRAMRQRNPQMAMQLDSNNRAVGPLSGTLTVVCVVSTTLSNSSHLLSSSEVLAFRVIRS